MSCCEACDFTEHYKDRTPVDCPECQGNGELLVSGDPRSDCYVTRECWACGGCGEVDPWEGIYDERPERAS